MLAILVIKLTDNALSYFYDGHSFPTKLIPLLDCTNWRNLVGSRPEILAAAPLITNQQIIP